jgi:hypothetical protein
MNIETQLAELERVASALSVRVCYEPMAGVVANTGGLCKVRGEYRVIIDRRLKAPERVQILADALRRFDVDAVECSPHVRQLFSGAR